MRLDEGEKLVSVGLATRDKVVVYGVNRAGKEVVAEITGDELEKHRLHRGRKGYLIGRRIRPVRLG
jgi:hypothetical protein